MTTLFAWIILPLLILAAYPWSVWLLNQNPRQDGRWLTIMLTLSISVGALTLGMFWIMLVGIPLSFELSTLLYLLLMFPGWLLYFRARNRNIVMPIGESASLSAQGGQPEQVVDKKLRYLAVAVFALLTIAIIFEAVYWPFSEPDVMGIYDRFADYMYANRALPPFGPPDDPSYQAYPIQISLLYTYVYMASGWDNEYLARIIPALLSLGCLPAVFVLGKMLYGSFAGWLGALLLAITPTFAKWASTGYVDLPMAFFYILSAIFAWRLWLTNHWTDALLAGLMMGLAAWTKNAALAGFAFLGIWLAWGIFNRRFSWRMAALAMTAGLIVAAPWYIRNLVERNLIIPPTVWIDQVQRNLTSALILITRYQNFAFTGPVIVLAVGAACWGIVRKQREAAPQILLLLWTIPFFCIWWIVASYDPRFIVLFLPVLCVIAGGWLADFWKWASPMRKQRIRPAFGLLVISMTLWVIFNAVRFKTEIVRNPLMTDPDKRAIIESVRDTR